MHRISGKVTNRASRRRQGSRTKLQILLSSASVSIVTELPQLDADSTGHPQSRLSIHTELGVELVSQTSTLH